MSGHSYARRRRLVGWVVVGLAVAVARPGFAAVETFEVDPARSVVAFEVRHLASTVTGTFSRFEGELRWERERPEAGVATFVIDVASLATDDERRTVRLSREDFFATSRFPKIHFRSTEWKGDDARGYEIIGTLTIKGVGKPVVVRAKPPPDDSGRWEATARLDRRDFGVTGGPPGLIGNDVDVRISLAMRSGRAERAAGTAAMVTMTAPDEPGERLRLRGTVFASDGKTPVAGAKLYVYHTDAAGRYSPGEAGVGDERNPRLQCRLATDDQGRFEIRTIFPGRYPGGRTPRHIHILVTPPGGAEQNATFQFAGDPSLTPDDYARHGRDGSFSGIRPAERGATGEFECVRDIRVRADR